MFIYYCETFCNILIINCSPAHLARSRSHSKQSYAEVDTQCSEAPPPSPPLVNTPLCLPSYPRTQSTGSNSLVPSATQAASCTTLGNTQQHPSPNFPPGILASPSTMPPQDRFGIMVPHYSLQVPSRRRPRVKRLDGVDND